MAANAVYKYMKTQNRPYSVSDIVTNLHNEHTKTAVQKAMDQLVTDGKLFEKVAYRRNEYLVKRMINSRLFLGLRQAKDILRRSRCEL